jgi:hypothetical protein
MAKSSVSKPSSRPSTRGRRWPCPRRGNHPSPGGGQAERPHDPSGSFPAARANLPSMWRWPRAGRRGGYRRRGLHRFVDIAAGLPTLRREAAAALSAEGDGRIRALEGEKASTVWLDWVSAHCPLSCRSSRASRACRVLRRRFPSCPAPRAGIVEFVDLLLPRGGGFIRRVVERDDGIVQIVEQRREPDRGTAAASAPCPDSGGRR